MDAVSFPDLIHQCTILIKIHAEAGFGSGIEMSSGKCQFSCVYIGGSMTHALGVGCLYTYCHGISHGTHHLDVFGRELINWSNRRNETIVIKLVIRKNLYSFYITTETAMYGSL